MRNISLFAAVLLFAAGSAYAQKEKFDPFGVEVPLPDAFGEIIDPNGDGAIDDEEAAQAEAAFLKLPKTRQPIGQEIRKALDANGDRKIDEEEAKLGVARGKAHHKGASNEVAEIVKHLDKNSDQIISVEEFRGLVKQFGVLGPFITPRLGQFFNQMDSNRNGEISLVEAQKGAEYLQEQIKQAEEENRRKARMRDPLYQQAMIAMANLDKNKDQLISKTEARKNKEVNAAFLTADTNLDEQLSIDECHDFLKLQAEGKNPGGQPKVEFLPKEDLKAAAKKKAK